MSDARLEKESVGKLLREFSIPSIIAMLVSSLYNIVDQFFIGRTVGELGNAATNIQFPLSTACIALALLCGIGSASNFNLSMGKSKFDPKERERAVDFMGNGLTMMVLSGTILLVITQLFLEPMLRAFGSPEEVLPYAMEYTRIVSIGFPFLIFSNGCGSLLRADGRPKMMMTCNLIGAVINTFLDAFFLFGLNLGMAGAAWATVIGQVISATLAGYFILHAKTVTLHRNNFLLKGNFMARIAALGIAQFINQVSMMIVQIVMNNSLKYYGANSVYGESIPIAAAGIITKVNMLFMAFIIGISQGLQPIVGYNYGARRFDRVKGTYLLAIRTGFIISVIAFILFFFFPRQIISIFGEGSDAYFEFSIRYFKTYLFCTFLNFLQPMSSNTYSAIGKPQGGAIMSLTRQIIFLLPLILILPRFFGMDGILYAGPIADALAFIVCAFIMYREFRRPEYREMLQSK